MVSDRRTDRGPACPSRGNVQSVSDFQADHKRQRANCHNCLDRHVWAGYAGSDAVESMCKDFHRNTLNALDDVSGGAPRQILPSPDARGSRALLRPRACATRHGFNYCPYIDVWHYGASTFLARTPRVTQVQQVHSCPAREGCRRHHNPGSHRRTHWDRYPENLPPGPVELSDRVPSVWAEGVRKG